MLWIETQRVADSEKKKENCSLFFKLVVCAPYCRKRVLPFLFWRHLLLHVENSLCSGAESDSIRRMCINSDILSKYVLNLWPTHTDIDVIRFALTSDLKISSRCGVPLRFDSTIWINVWGVMFEMLLAACAIYLFLSNWIMSNSFLGLTFLELTRKKVRFPGWGKYTAQLWHLNFESYQHLKCCGNFEFLCKTYLRMFFQESLLWKTWIIYNRIEYFRII